MNDTTEMQMPKYNCHKQVWALKIACLQRVLVEIDGKKRQEVRMASEEKGFAPIALSKEFIDKHKPEVGGYYVVYKDGYKSYSPADVFEDGYSLA